MKALQIILISLVALFSIYSSICGFMPKDFKVMRSVDINAPLHVVFDEVNDFNNLEHWSPWKELDPAMMTKVDGKPADAIYKYTWSSKNDKVGHGSLTRKHAEQDKFVSNELLLEDFNMHSNVDWTFETTPEGTKATWTNSGTLPFFTRIMAGKLESMMAPDLEKGLQLLKVYCEAKPLPVANTIKIEVVTIQPMNYLFVHDTAGASSISAKLGALYMKVGTSMAKQKLTMTGPVFAIYYSDTLNTFDFDAAIPVDKLGKKDGEVKAGLIPSGNAVVAHYFGDYMLTRKAH